jgi:hypothetical protein
MTTKPRILVDDSDPVVINRDGNLKSIFSQYVDVVKYRPGISLNDFDVAMTLGHENHRWFTDLVNCGVRLIIDNQWEHQMTDYLVKKHNGQVFIWSAKNFFWVNEYHWYKELGYDNYRPNKDYKHTAFMPIRQLKPARRDLVQALEPYLGQILYSIMDQCRYLPGDRSPDLLSTQRYIDPLWYDNTYFSIVAETITETYTDWLPDVAHCIHITEKTYKAMSFYHPFMIFGQTGTLAELRRRGFETFENLFDESYDTEKDQTKRLNSIVDNVARFVPKDYNQLTWEKLEHNHSLFYNSSVVDKILKEEIITPLVEYAFAS